MHENYSNRLLEFLKKVRDSDVEYDDYWVERLVKALPKVDETKNAVIESLKAGTGKIRNEDSYYYIHFSLIREIISNGNRSFWDNNLVKNFVQQFLKNMTLNHSTVVMNALFLLYCELEDKNLPYEDEDIVQKALQLLNGNADMTFKVTMCCYLDRIFGRKYNARWAHAIAELLETTSSESSDKSNGNPELRRRLSELLLIDPSLLSEEHSRKFFILAKNLRTQTDHINASDNKIISTDFHFCKLLAELVQRKKMDEKIFFDDDWCCVHIRNKILLHLIAMGRVELIRIVLDTPKLRLLDLVELGHHSDESLMDYFERGLSVLSEENNALSTREFIASLKNPSTAMLDSLYHTLELRNMINSVVLDALLEKSEVWNSTIMPVLAAKAVEQLKSSKWEHRDTALNHLIVLMKYGYNGSDLVQCISSMAKDDEEPYVRREALAFLKQIGNPEEVGHLAVDILLSDSDSTPRIEAAKMLQDGLPQTEKLLLDLIPKILYDEDVALHRVIIEICAKLVANGRNEELRDLLIKFQEDEVDCYEQLSEILRNNNDLSKERRGENDDLEYLFNVLAKIDAEGCDKDCYDL